MLGLRPVSIGCFRSRGLRFFHVGDRVYSDIFPGAGQIVKDDGTGERRFKVLKSDGHLFWEKAKDLTLMERFAPTDLVSLKKDKEKIWRVKETCIKMGVLLDNGVWYQELELTRIPEVPNLLMAKLSNLTLGQIIQIQIANEKLGS
jgi:hypothetical protein